jgi:hypothetical protein
MNISDSIEKLNKKQQESGPGFIGCLITPEDGSFVRTNNTEDYFGKLRAAYFKAKSLGFPIRKEDGTVDLEDYFDEAV